MMRAAVAVALLFAARYGVTSWFDRRHDADLVWQNWLGLQALRAGHLPNALGAETFTAGGAPWVPQEWALSLAVAFSGQHGLFAVLAILAACSGVAAILLTALASRKMGASISAATICTICVGFSMVASYGVRAQVFAWPLLATFMLVVRCARGARQWLLVPIAVLWANVHASAPLAPVLLAVWTAGVLLEDRGWTPRVRHFALLTAASAAAICLTPLGLRMPILALQMIHSPMRMGIQEWNPTTLSDDVFRFGLLPLMIAAMITGVWRARKSEVLLFLFAVLLGLSAVRNVPVAAIIVAPFVALQLTALLPESRRIERFLRERAATGILLGFCAIAGAALALQLARSPLSGVTLPEKAMAVAAALPGEHNAYCEDWAWCSLALAYPNMRTFVDGRCDGFPLTVWRQQYAIADERPQWSRLLDRWRVDVILARHAGALAQTLQISPQWKLRYADSRYALFVRVAPRARGASRSA
jgi:hypothetical protein